MSRRSHPSRWPRKIRLLALLPLLGAVWVRAALLVTHLQCDRMTDPIGVDSPTPQLSWQLESVERGSRQTAWQVQVASTLPALVDGRADRWDSGKVASEAQYEIGYAGKVLATGEQVFWRVRTWDADGQVSSWSQIGTWTMGLTKPEDAIARWITDPALLTATREKLGFSTPPSPNPDSPQWVALDLGKPWPIESVALDAIVHTLPERLGFPIDFKLELADNPTFANATTLADPAKSPGLRLWRTRVVLNAPRTVARYVRLSVGTLRMMEEEGSPGRLGRLALRQMEVWSEGRNVAVGARVTASGSVEDDRWSAAALVDGKEIPGGNPRAAQTLLLRREFVARDSIRRATLYVTGLGTYLAAINGSPVGGEDLLKPAWTDPSRTCFYDTRDVTALIRTGPNALGLTLAGGMYNVPAIPGRYTKFVSAPRALVAWAQLRIDYADGPSETIVTSPEWKAAPGPTTLAHVYGGEDYDARRVAAGWDQPGFDDRDWKPAVGVPGPGGTLKGASFASPPVRIQATLPPWSRHELRPGVAVYDFGQNAAVMLRLRVHGPAGASVKIAPAELVKPDGAIDPSSTRPSDADASWNYTLAGAPAGETWVPQFFYHGSRYFQVECRTPDGAAPPVVDELVATVVHSDSPRSGTFACSDELFNRIATMIEWAQRSNLGHVLTDCPHRERLGWQEQYYLNGPALRYDFDLTRLYAKGFQDMADAQRPSGLVPAIAPEYITFSEGFRDSPEWGSSIILAAWQQFVWTGDETSLRRNYEAMRRYFHYLESKATGHIVDFGLGDWYDVGPNPPGIAQLTPIALSATATFYEDARALQRIAGRLGRPADARFFQGEADAIAAAFNARFLDPAKGIYATGSQTAQAMPLALGLVPSAQARLVADQLVADIRGRANALTAGDVGYHYLLRALADAGRSDVLYDLNNQSERPGYGYQLAHGATSLPEAWDANRHSSQNHFMLGQIIEWFYHDLAGLAPDPSAPGFARMLVRPNPVGDLTWARATYESVRGPTEVAWRRSPGRLVVQVRVPPNARALVALPGSATARIVESGMPVDRAAHVRRVDESDGRPTFEIDAGRYEFTVTE